MSTNGYMATSFAVSAIPLFFGMKIVSVIVKREKTPEMGRFLFLTPLHSVDTWADRKRFKGTDVKRLAVRTGALTLIYVIIVYFSDSLRDFVSRMPRGLWGFSVLPFVLFMGEFISSALILASLTSGYRIPDYHRSPLRSATLAEFWGTRWNVWQSDWFKQVIFSPLRRSPTTAVLIVFLVSGLAHELLFTLPLYLRTGMNAFGGMTVYFVLQGGGILIDRKVFGKSNQPCFRRFFLWLWLLLPTPLFIGEAVLRTLHVWPER